MSEPPFISVRDVAALLGISVSSVWRHAKDGILPAPIKIGGSTRFRRDEVLAAVDTLQKSREGRREERTTTSGADIVPDAKEPRS